MVQLGQIPFITQLVSLMVNPSGCGMEEVSMSFMQKVFPQDEQVKWI